MKTWGNWCKLHLIGKNYYGAKGPTVQVRRTKITFRVSQVHGFIIDLGVLDHNIFNTLGPIICLSTRRIRRLQLLFLSHKYKGL